MLYFGNSLLSHTPAYCPGNNADCPKHGFGLKQERADEIVAAFHTLTDACQDKQALTVDFPRLMAGPPDLDLLSPTEILFAGYVLGVINVGLTEWIDEVNPEHQLPEPIQSMARAARKNGGIVSVQSINVGDAPQHIRDIITRFMEGTAPQQDDEREAGQ